METLGCEVLKQISEALLEVVQCPICLVALRPPVTLCSSGHGLCPDCKPNVQECPTCREGFIDTKPIILHQLLDALPRDCKFKSLGCTNVYIPGGNHEQLCSYRTVDCKIIECQWSGQARRLNEHVTSDHDHETVDVELGVKKEVSWEGFNCTEDSFKYIPFVADGEVFWAYMYMSTQVSKLCVSFTQVPNGISNFQYFMIVMFKNGDIQYTHTIKIPFDTHLAFLDFLEDHCMMIPQGMVPRFLTENSSLTYSVHVIKEDKAE